MTTETVPLRSVSRAPASSRRTVFWILCALAGFVLLCLLVRKALPLHIPTVSYKLQTFAGRKDKFDVVFIGTSRVFHGIAPETFDATARELGFRSTSFNAGIDGMDAEEAFSFTRRLLAFHPHRLHYLLFELSSGVGAGIPVGKMPVTVRNVYWHDWPSLVSAARAFALGMSLRSPDIAGPPFSKQRFSFFGTIFFASVRLWAKNETGYGEGFERVGQAITVLRGRPFHDVKPGKKWDGYFAMSRPMSGEPLTTYRKSFARVKASTEARKPDPVMERELARFVDRLAAKKIRVVFVVPPSLEGGREGGINCPPGSPLLSYDDYLRYPEFYTEDHRLDSEHLNAAGAEIFTRRLATDFVHALPVR